MSATKKVQQATMVVKSVDADAKIRQQFERMDNAALVKAGTTRLDVIRQAQHEYDILLTILESRFPAEKTLENMVFPAGMATRKVDNVWKVDGSRIDELRQVLGPARYHDVITEEKVVKVTDDSARKLREILGVGYDSYFMESDKYTVTAAGRAFLRDDARMMKKLSKAITIVQKVKVTITPSWEGKEAKPL